MAENTQAQSPVNDTQGASMPNAQQAQKTPEPEKGTDGTLPEDTKQRTRDEFEKLQGQLREERQARERIEQAYQAQFQPKKTEPVEPPLIDPVTGLIDERGLTSLQKTAKQALEEARIAKEEALKYRQQGEYAQAYQKYAWTNPQSKDFDEKRSNLAAAIALASMVEPKRYGGKQLDLAGAAEFVEGLTSRQVEQVKQQAAKDAIEQLSPKEQASLEATGSAGRREPESPIDYEYARTITRKGGNEGLVATMARLKALKQNQAKT